MRILRRCNIFLTDAASNFRIPQLQQHYDLVAARPTDERTLQQACQNLDVDIISLDLTRRFETHFKFPMLGTAISRGIKIELCYSQGIMSSDPSAKRNLISNATQIIRVTRGRGLIFSSEAKTVLGIRAPSDIINLASPPEKPVAEAKVNKNQNGKRPGENLEGAPVHETKTDKPISKRQQAKNKKAKMQEAGQEVAA
ncbi:hypothetical protein PTT_10551 [Pyrenophora teres f. teres 0-1]|uniref:Uncharacterized protein n=1 Tax=Pyrenophora teres f. teres (strain 0-1) TaxID=861557 RepID=E3RPI8_PYRTT|nr:hypothetical protein PTT_10551 [Pyrenophora teres f. teres 0-1]